MIYFESNNYNFLILNALEPPEENILENENIETITQNDSIESNASVNYPVLTVISVILVLFFFLLNFKHLKTTYKLAILFILVIQLLILMFHLK